MDSNLLISTVATSTAALIAIIGGFLVSRVITLASEREGQKQILRDVFLDISNREYLFQKAKEELLAYDHDRFINEYAEKLIDDNISLEDIFEEEEEELYMGWDIDEFRSAYEEFIMIKDHVIEIIHQDQLTSSVELVYDFDEFMKQNTSDLLGNKSWYEIIYYHFQERESPFGYSVSTMLAPSSASFVKERRKSYQEKEKEFHTHNNELTFLYRKKTEHEKILKNFGGTNNMWAGLLVLVYASIVGIVIPVTWGLYGSSPNKTMILCLFLSQLVALFIYLGCSMYSLTKNEKNNKEEQKERITT